MSDKPALELSCEEIVRVRTQAIEMAIACRSDDAQPSAQEIISTATKIAAFILEGGKDV